MAPRFWFLNASPHYKKPGCPGATADSRSWSEKARDESGTTCARKQSGDQRLMGSHKWLWGPDKGAPTGEI